MLYSSRKPAVRPVLFAKLLQLYRLKKQARAQTSFLRSIGVLLCILSPVSFILAGALVEGTGAKENIPIAIATGIFFLCIAIAVGIFVFSGVRMHAWNEMKKEPLHLDYATTQTIRAQRDAEHTHTLLMKTIGIVLCVICFVPVAVMGALDTKPICCR